MKLSRIQQNKIETRVAVVSPKTYDEKTRSFEVIAGTEEPANVLDYERWEIVSEVLLMEGMRFPDASRGQVPLLDTHDRWTIDSVLGSARDWRAENGQAICRTVLSSVEDGVEAETKIREGHITDVSLGYCVNESTWIPENTSTTINGRTFKGPLKVATDWTVRELSLVPIGADQYAKFRSFRASQLGLPEDANDELIRHEIKKRANNNPQPTRKDSNIMTPEELAALQASIRAAQEQITALQNAGNASATALETSQREAEDAKEILATATRMSTVPGIFDLAKKAVDEKRSAKDFMKDVLEAVGKAPSPITPAGERKNISLSDFVRPWQRRAVQYLNVVVTEKRNPEVGREKRMQYIENLKKISDVQKDDELREAAQKIITSGISEMQQHRLMSALSAGAGGNLVPTPMLAEIFILVEKWGVARRYFRPIPMTQNTLKLDSLTTEAIAYWTDEGSNITASDLGFGQGTLTAKKLAAIGAWSHELDEDSAVALLPIVIDSFARAIKKKEDLAAFIGDGSGTYGTMTGLLAFAGNVVTLDNGKTAFTDANADDYKALRDAVNIDFRDGAGYFLSPASVSSLEGLKDSQGRYIYREPAAGLPAQLWGFPIFDNVGINALTQTSAVATKFAAFGNPKLMLMGMRREIEILASREGVLDSSGTVSFNALQADGEILRITERIGIKGVLASGLSVLKTAAA